MLVCRPLVRPLVQLNNALMQLLVKFLVEPPLQLLEFLLEPLLELPVQFLLEPPVGLQSQLHPGPQMDLVLKNHPEFLVKFLPGEVKLLVPPTLTAVHHQGRRRPLRGTTRQ